MFEPGHSLLPELELERRAKRIKLVLTDCDGVLTDAGVYYSEQGEQLKRFSLRDGMGVELLRNGGVATAIITREISGPVQKRAQKLQLPHLFEGVRDKLAHLPEILRVTGLEADALAYIGDDVNDLPIITEISERGGLTAAPMDAVDEVAKVVHYRTKKPGGFGAFRDFADLILRWQRAHRADQKG
jgi:3-deoxy-D-manno-octulosonate 8-phosphate phosphatase (KDO 8-P phosphatase)